VRREGDSNFVRGVAVCTQDTPNTADRSIRGLKVFYSRVKEDGTLEKSDDPEVWSGEGCAKWEDRVTCPDGMLAVGIRGHRDAKGYRAMGLVCSPLANR
jgi:hypothetical protein